MATHRSSYEPIGRFGYAAVAVGSKVHIWRGAGPNRNVEEFASTVEVFDVTTELWEQKSIQGIPPPGRSNTASTVVGTSLYSFGGFDGKAFSNSLYQLDLHTLEWKELMVRNPCSGPQRKRGSRMVSYGDNQLIVFAGKGDNGFTNEMHIFNIDKGEWSSPSVTGTKPSPCYNFSFTKIDSRRAVVFGGLTSKGSLGDTYVLELDNLHWSKVDTQGHSPRARWGHAACCIAGPFTGEEHPLLLVDRGYTDQGVALRDIWMLDVERGIWNKVTLPKGMRPRGSHSVTVFGCGPNFRVLVLFGGRRTFAGQIVAETTLLYVERFGGKWEVTKVVTKENLGEPKERLNEKMRKLQLLSGSGAMLDEISNSDLEFIEKVGSGGFGSVWKGQWISKQKIVAIKILVDIDEREEREVSILSLMDHPCIIQYYGVVMKKPSCYIVTEYAENGSILDYIHKKHKQPSLTQSLQWAKEVAAGMIYLHGKNIIHRDLKSSNVVLTFTLKAKICDLGSARRLDQTVRQTTAVGTYAWMAPEMMQREPLSKLCDVYSYGIFLWELLTQQQPFADVFPSFMVMTKVLAGEHPPIPETCEAYLEKLLIDCWKMEAKARPSFEDILVILNTGATTENDLHQ